MVTEETRNVKRETRNGLKSPERCFAFRDSSFAFLIYTLHTTPIGPLQCISWSPNMGALEEESYEKEGDSGGALDPDCGRRVSVLPQSEQEAVEQHPRLGQYRSYGCCAVVQNSRPRNRPVRGRREHREKG